MRGAGVGHDLLADGQVRVRVPAGGVMSEADARRLAWGLLSDLAPDEVLPVAEVVTAKEAQRLEVLRAIGRGCTSAVEIAGSLNWQLRQVQRRLPELVGDGRVLADGAKAGRRYRLAVPSMRPIPTETHNELRI